MHFSTLLVATLAATTTALNTQFFCASNKQGGCCLHFNPTTGFGELSGVTGHKATELHIPVDPGSQSEWECANNVDFLPACCDAGKELKHCIHRNEPPPAGS